MRNLLLWDAIISWRDDVLNRDVLLKSKRDYLSNMVKLIERGLFDLEEPLSEFVKNGISDQIKAIDSTSDWSLSTKLSRRTLLRSFFGFVQTSKNIKHTDIVIPFKDLRDPQKAVSELIVAELLTQSLSGCEDKAKSQPLTEQQFERFFNEIRSINERDFLICWTMWQLKCSIHHVLNFKVGDYDQTLGIFKISENDFRLGEIRPELKELIIEKCEGKGTNELIFSTNTGQSIHPGQIVRNMKTASKKAKLPIIISPKILYAHAIAYSRNAFLSMTEKDIEEISKINHARLEKSEKLKNTIAE